MINMAVDDRDWNAFVFQIFVKTPADGKTILLEVASSDSVLYVKKCIADKSGVPADEQRLICCLYQLEEDRCLSDYNIGNAVNIMVLLRMRSSMDDRLSAVEGSIAEIELNYATDN